MRYYHGKGATPHFFESWCFKLSDSCGTVTFIPTVYRGANGIKRAFVQVITPQGTHCIEYPFEDFFAHEKRLYVKIGRSVFSACGCFIHIKTPQFSCTGKVLFSKLRPPKRNFTGVFGAFSSHEFQQSILSLNHSLSGRLLFHETPMVFDKGNGYIQCNFGSSFPTQYRWFQCNYFDSYVQQPYALELGVDLVQNLSVVAFSTTYPLHKKHLQGFVALVHYQNFFYRFTPFSGGKLLRHDIGALAFRQGLYELYLYPEPNESPHSAPSIISTAAPHITQEWTGPAKVELWRGKRLIVRASTTQASFT